MPEFSIGIILYLVYEKVLSRKQHLRNQYPLLILMSGMIVLSSLCAFFVAYGYGGINTWIATKAFYTTACAFGYALLLLSFLLFFDGKKVRVYALFLFLGSLSYGTYLLHGIFPRLADLLGIQVNKSIAYFLYTGIVLLLAFLCYRYIENPLRNQGRRLAERVGSGSRSEVIQ